MPSHKSPFHSLAAALVSLEIWVVAAAVAASFVMPGLLLYAVLVEAIFWPLRWLAAGYLTRRTPLDWPIFLLALMLPVTLWATSAPEITIPQVYRLLSGIGLYYAIVNWGSSERRLKWLGGGVFLGGGRVGPVFADQRAVA